MYTYSVDLVLELNGTANKFEQVGWLVQLSIEFQYAHVYEWLMHSIHYLKRKINRPSLKVFAHRLINRKTL